MLTLIISSYKLTKVIQEENKQKTPSQQYLEKQESNNALINQQAQISSRRVNQSIDNSFQNLLGKNDNNIKSSHRLQDELSNNMMVIYNSEKEQIDMQNTLKRMNNNKDNDQMSSIYGEDQLSTKMLETNFHGAEQRSYRGPNPVSNQNDDGTQKIKYVQKQAVPLDLLMKQQMMNNINKDRQDEYIFRHTKKYNNNRNMDKFDYYTKRLDSVENKIEGFERKQQIRELKFQEPEDTITIQNEQDMNSTIDKMTATQSKLRAQKQQKYISEIATPLSVARSVSKTKSRNQVMPQVLNAENINNNSNVRQSLTLIPASQPTIPIVLQMIHPRQNDEIVSEQNLVDSMVRDERDISRKEVTHQFSESDDEGDRANKIGIMANEVDKKKFILDHIINSPTKKEKMRTKFDQKRRDAVGRPMITNANGNILEDAKMTLVIQESPEKRNAQYSTMQPKSRPSGQASYYNSNNQYNTIKTQSSINEEKLCKMQDNQNSAFQSTLHNLYRKKEQLKMLEMSDNSHSDHHIINDGRDRTRSSKRDRQVTFGSKGGERNPMQESKLAKFYESVENVNSHRHHH